MASEKLRRTTYRDPTSDGIPVRTGSVACSEGARDMDEYYRPVGKAIHLTTNLAYSA